MTHIITLTLHGLKAHLTDALAGQSPAEDRYTITASQYLSLVQVMAEHPSCTISESMLKSGGAWVVLTFDDGFLSDYEQAFPILLDVSIKATFFVTVENIGKPGYMDVGQIREWHLMEWRSAAMG
jgi:hypothetical protein